jgi:selenocysteine-specific elongation factor
VKNLIIGTAGHIDHGKTALVRALTGIDTDRFEEEKRRGITIDIGFAHLDLGDYRLGFIDVPGHEKFVKNMLAGIGGVHLLLLIVAADESVMPQTLEHLQICQLLDIPKGLVVITKKTLVDEDLVSLVKEEIKDLTQGTLLEGAPIVAVDSIEGDGIPQLLESIKTEADQIDRNRLEFDAKNRIFRLPVDRVFSVRGFGTVVTGTTLWGELKKDNQVAVYPSQEIAKVRGIEVFNTSSSSALPGQRTAVNLSNIDKQDLNRGMTLSIPAVPKSTNVFDASIRVIRNAPGPLRNRSPVRIHHGSAELIGRVRLLDSRVLEPGQSGMVQLRTDAPLLCFPGDHLILRRYSPLTTVGGGIVLNNAPRKHRKSELPDLLEQLTLLEQAMAGSVEKWGPLLCELIVEEAGSAGAHSKELVARTGFSESYIRSVLPSIPSLMVVSRMPLLALHRKPLEELNSEIVQVLSQYHEAKPLGPGFSKEELKKRLMPGGSSACFQFVLKRLEEAKAIVVDGKYIRLRHHRADLDREQEKIREEILLLVRQAGFQIATLDETLGKLGKNRRGAREVAFHMLSAGQLIRISESLIVTQDILDQLAEGLKAKFPEGRTFTVPEFKNLFSISRKYAIPLLEFLDRERITSRTGDKRKVFGGSGAR